MKYKGHFRIDQNKTVSKNISKSTLILHNNIKDYLIWIPANIKTKNLLTEEQQRKRGMFCVDGFPKDDLISFFGTVIFINCLFGSIHKC